MYSHSSGTNFITFQLRTAIRKVSPQLHIFFSDSPLSEYGGVLREALARVYSRASLQKDLSDHWRPGRCRPHRCCEVSSSVCKHPADSRAGRENLAGEPCRFCVTASTKVNFFLANTTLRPSMTSAPSWGLVGSQSPTCTTKMSRTSSKISPTARAPPDSHS